MLFPYRIYELVLIFIALVIAGVYAAQIRAAEDTSYQPSPTTSSAPSDASLQATSEELEIVKLTNQQRQDHGLRALELDPKLTVAAREHSANMARAKVLAHTLDGSTMTDRIKGAGYKFFAIGENVAFNEPTPAATLKAWMNSSHHRANILNEVFTEIGVGIARDDEGQPYYTQDFGRPVTAGPTASATFSITNNANAVATIVLPGSSNATRLDPGASGSFTVSGTGSLPPLKISAGNETRETPFENGAEYVIEQSPQGIRINTKR
jgi:uncharacterized protein YkwD